MDGMDRDQNTDNADKIQQEAKETRAIAQRINAYP